MADLKTALRTADKSENIQDVFLNNARRDRALVTVVLMNGGKLAGKLRSFDRFSLILDINHQDQLIFKHAIATITAQGRPGAAGATDANGGDGASASPTR